MNIFFFLIPFMIARAVPNPNPETDSSGASNGETGGGNNPKNKKKGFFSEGGRALKSGVKETLAPVKKRADKLRGKLQRARAGWNSKEEDPQNKSEADATE